VAGACLAEDEIMEVYVRCMQESCYLYKRICGAVEEHTDIADIAPFRSTVIKNLLVLHCTQSSLGTGQKWDHENVSAVQESCYLNI
jgi:hypothetical protein